MSLQVFQHTLSHDEVHGRVINNKQPCIRTCERPVIVLVGRRAVEVLAFACQQLFVFFDVAGEALAGQKLRYLDGEDAPFAILALGEDLSVHKLHKIANERQAQPRALNALSLVHVHAAERYEQLVDVFVPYADARVAD